MTFFRLSILKVENLSDKTTTHTADNGCRGIRGQIKQGGVPVSLAVTLIFFSWAWNKEVYYYSA